MINSSVCSGKSAEVKWNNRHRSGNNEFFALVNTGHYDQAPSKFLQYTAAHGKHPLGLVRRRRAEGRLFATGNYDATH
ncbi:glycoside hydrolase family protein [Paraburkholderia sp. 31.1]|uniref:glycoside hydrolase family protein n=1 Tax=Paraburkholderia sp. 31.1 TaxID=2615205 RepID=UPI003974D071